MPTTVQVVSLHDQRDGVLAFDLKDVLLALQGQIEQWVWCITKFDGVGAGSESICRAVETSPGGGFWVSSDDLVRLAGGVTQTIDATLVAFPRTNNPRTVGEAEVWNFPTSAAEAVVRAVDSSFFEVYTKDPQITAELRRRFKDARIEDPQLYFA